MKKVKKIALALVCVLLVGALCGCGAKFDASGYLGALLDNSYKGDSKAFVDTKIGTAEEAAKLYEEGIDAEMSGLLAGVSLSAELEDEFRAVIKDMLGKVKYTVGEAEKQSDKSYVVTITYEQMKIFEPTMEQYTADITEMMTEWANAPESAPSEDEMTEALYAAMKDCLKENLANVEYAEPATTTVRIELSNNVYAPNQSDIQNLETLFLDTDAVQ